MADEMVDNKSKIFVKKLASIDEIQIKKLKRKKKDCSLCNAGGFFIVENLSYFFNFRLLYFLEW